MQEIAKDLLFSLFTYKDGEIYWAVNKGRMHIGDIAGTVNSTGRKQVCINQKLYKVHRIIYVMHYGKVPKFIDHIDGNPLNNRIENLRGATYSENMFNVSVKRNNTSGEKGVGWNAKRKRWFAYTFVEGKKIYAGYHEKFESAVNAVRELRKTLHGSFAKN